jgi:type I restriction enzyme, S subunit
MTDELPAGWAKASLEAVGLWGSGGTPSRGDPNAYGGSIPWLKIGDLTDGRIETGSITFCVESPKVKRPWRVVSHRVVLAGG